MTEYRFVTFSQPTSTVFPSAVPGASALTLDLAGSIPEVAEHMDGWDVVNTQVLPNGEVTYLVFTLRTEVSSDTFEGREVDDGTGMA